MRYCECWNKDLTCNFVPKTFPTSSLGSTKLSDDFDRLFKSRLLRLSKSSESFMDPGDEVETFRPLIVRKRKIQILRSLNTGLLLAASSYKRLLSYQIKSQRTANLVPTEHLWLFDMRKTPTIHGHVLGTYLKNCCTNATNFCFA